MSTQINRRSLLVALPAIAAVPAVALSGEVLPPIIETSVMRAYREYIEYRDWTNGPESRDWTDEEMDRATAGLDDYLGRIVSARSEGPADTAIKMFAVVEDYEALYGNPYREALWAEARALVA